MLSNINNISLSLCINKVLFSDNYMEMIKEFDAEFSKCFFTKLSLNIINNNFVTEFDENINHRLYEILSYYREIYRKEPDFKYVNTMVNDSISVLNTLNIKHSLYESQFHKRFKTIYNFFVRKRFIKRDYDLVMDAVKASICNDLVLFQNIRKLDCECFVNAHKCDLISVSSVLYLASCFPEILRETEFKDKMLKLLDTNIKLSYDIPTDGDILFSSSVLTEHKILKKVNK